MAKLPLILRKTKFQHGKEVPGTGERWDRDYLFWKRIDTYIADIIHIIHIIADT